MKPAAWLGFLIIAGALAFSAKAFVSNLTPYVTFDQARSAKGVVQVMGKLDKKSVRTNADALAFDIVADNGDRMPVRFTAARPANFEMAVQVTAIGKFDGKKIEADNLLVKCPTKYEGTETKEYGAKAGKTGKA
ncbi:MAG: cytochrome c maturation protein CcmE [Cytophagales bacterium]|nr:cytochrome c maturation protein CcmE [Armatimonadota bacterium]